jgi:sugar lactone lactonase YvrE
VHTLRYAVLLPFSLLLASAALTGCGGGTASFPDAVVSASADGPPLSGSVYGGHAPLQGAHVYLLQPGITGYGSAAASILGNNGATSVGQYAITADTSDPNVPVGAKYETTDSNGGFNFTGAYKCTVGQPVYIYSFGGNIGSTPATLNTSIVQLATLGNCPSSGNFSTPGNGALSFVYLNEVSTVAAAYTFQPFTLSTNNDAWHIGSSGTTQALLGIANAANTAAQLYSIQGNGPTSTTADGEGHIANATTPNGNGTVPQATVNTLANILAACVDSTTASSQCTAIFNVATDNGETTGTKPIDTATAAINIARYPAGNSTGSVNATFASALFAVPSGTVPYTPALAAAPNDWTLSIVYTGGGIGETPGQSPHDVAVDASGNIYTTSFSGNKLAIFSPLGVPASPSGFGTALDGPDSVAIDSTSSFVWLVNYSGKSVSRFTTAGGGEMEFSVGQAVVQDAEFDGSGNVWVTSDIGSALTKLNSAGTVQTTITANMVSPIGLAIQPGAAGSIWVADEEENDASAVTNAGVALSGSPFSGNSSNHATDVDAPNGVAIDSTGHVWLTNGNGTVSALTSTGGDVTGSPFSTGSTNYSDGIAIDGSNNIWVTNSLSNTVFVLNDAGAEITPKTGFLSKPVTKPDGIAIDPSGNVWYDSANAGVLYELVGAASPTVTPLSYAVANSKLGAKP